MALTFTAMFLANQYLPLWRLFNRVGGLRPSSDVPIIALLNIFSTGVILLFLLAFSMAAER